RHLAAQLLQRRSDLVKDPRVPGRGVARQGLEKDIEVERKTDGHGTARSRVSSGTCDGVRATFCRQHYFMRTARTTQRKTVPSAPAFRAVAAGFDGRAGRRRFPRRRSYPFRVAGAKPAPSPTLTRRPQLQVGTQIVLVSGCLLPYNSNVLLS